MHHQWYIILHQPTNQISSQLDHPLQSYDVIVIFKMAAVSHVGFALEL